MATYIIFIESVRLRELKIKTSNFDVKVDQKYIITSQTLFILQ